MDFTYVEFPSTVNWNTFKAYSNLNEIKLPKIHGKTIQASELVASEGSDLNTNAAKSLRHLALDAIVENWSDVPFYKEIPRQEDRNYILSNLDVNLPLQLLTAHIHEDFFWRRSYQQRWRTFHHSISTLPESQRPWIKIYMERHLQEFIENLETADYDLESLQKTLDVCAPYINQLKINHLQPTPTAQAVGEGRNDHIPLDYILSNLPELRTLRLTYCTKTVGTNFYLGCNRLSERDTVFLARGLSRCYELVDFCLHNTKLLPYQLRFMAKSLDKGCHHLTALAFKHCGLGDEGIKEFMETCNRESFETLRELNLENNKISPDGAYTLSRALRGLRLEKLVLRLNPIRSDGAAAIFSVLNDLPIKVLDISGCSLCDKITKLFMQLVIQNRTIIELDLSNNTMGEEFGKHLYKIIGFNKTIRIFDLRNTGLSSEMRNKFKTVLKKNALEKKSILRKDFVPKQPTQVSLKNSTLGP